VDKKPPWLPAVAGAVTGLVEGKVGQGRSVIARSTSENLERDLSTCRFIILTSPESEYSAET